MLACKSSRGIALHFQLKVLSWERSEADNLESHCKSETADLNLLIIWLYLAMFKYIQASGEFFHHLAILKAHWTTEKNMWYSICVSHPCAASLFCGGGGRHMYNMYMYLFVYLCVYVRVCVLNIIASPPKCSENCSLLTGWKRSDRMIRTFSNLSSLYTTLKCWSTGVWFSAGEKGHFLPKKSLFSREARGPLDSYSYP